MKLAKLNCKEDVIIYGRNQDGNPDHCFFKGKDYLFCLDEKKGDIFTYNEVKEVHFLALDDYYTDKYFDVIKIAEIEDFNLDEFTHKKHIKLNKEKYHYEEI